MARRHGIAALRAFKPTMTKPWNRYVNFLIIACFLGMSAHFFPRRISVAREICWLALAALMLPIPHLSSPVRRLQLTGNVLVALGFPCVLFFIGTSETAFSWAMICSLAILMTIRYADRAQTANAAGSRR